MRKVESFVWISNQNLFPEENHNYFSKISKVLSPQVLFSRKNELAPENFHVTHNVRGHFLRKERKSEKKQSGGGGGVLGFGENNGAKIPREKQQGADGEYITYLNTNEMEVVLFYFKLFYSPESE